MALKKPISTRVLERSEKKLSNGIESMMTTELSGSNGLKYVIDGIIRSTETAGQITRITTMRTRRFASQSDSIPISTELMTIFEDITVGDIEGDYRWYTAEYTFVTEEGIKRFPPYRDKRPIVNPYSGLSEDELTDKVFTLLKLK